VLFDPALGCFLAARYAESGFTGVKDYFAGVAIEALICVATHELSTTS
jgi:hypothetical protein